MPVSSMGQRGAIERRVYSAAWTEVGAEEDHMINMDSAEIADGDTRQGFAN